MGIESEFLVACELHSVSRLRELLDDGLDACALVKGKRPLRCLTEMYTRSERFPECVRLLLERGGELDDPLVAPVLLDDSTLLATALRDRPALLRHRTTMASAFTPLDGASLLHVAAEFGAVNAMRTLLEHGAEVDARTDVDANGLGGQTPLFHTVNAHDDRAAPLREMLLAAGARADVRLAGLVWGRGFEWETTLFDLTPISYAQLGLLPQLHRNEEQVADIVRQLLAAGGRSVPEIANVPNRYLRTRGGDGEPNPVNE